MACSEYLKNSDRPQNHYRPDIRKAALVVIDMQNFACAPEYGKALPGMDTVIDNINRLADFCHESGIPVIWVRHNITITKSGTDAGLFTLFHDPEHLKEMTNKGKGTEIFSAMHYEPSQDHVVFKNRYSAFLSNPPELSEKLKALERSQIIVAGIAANVCVESTVRDAMQLDYEVILVSGAVTAPDSVLLRASLKNVRQSFGDVMTVQEIMGKLKEKK